MIVIDPRSRLTFSHFMLNSSPCLIPVFNANVARGKSHGEVTCVSHTCSNRRISSRLRNHVRSLLMVNRFTAAAGLFFVRSHSTAFLNICLMTVSRLLTVARFNVLPCSPFHYSICHVVICASGVSPNRFAHSLTM